jgi:hypothetical protein
MVKFLKLLALMRRVVGRMLVVLAIFIVLTSLVPHPVEMAIFAVPVLGKLGRVARSIGG